MLTIILCGLISGLFGFFITSKSQKKSSIERIFIIIYYAIFGGVLGLFLSLSILAMVFEFENTLKKEYELVPIYIKNQKYAGFKENTGSLILIVKDENGLSLFETHSDISEGSTNTVKIFKRTRPVKKWARLFVTGSILYDIDINVWSNAKFLKLEEKDYM